MSNLTIIIFYKHNYGFSGAIHLWIFNHRSKHCSDGNHLLILCLPARPYLVVVDEEAPTPVSLHLPLGTDVIFPVWVCLFLQGLLRNLGYLLVLDFQTCPIWIFTWGLHSVLEGLFLYQCLWGFWRESQSDQQVFPVFPAQTGFIIFYLLIH